MSRRSSSSRWYRTQSSDPFVKQREKLGLRSRAAFKLTEILEKDRLLRPGATVLDLGASPGGWSQVAAQVVGAHGLVVAVDILPMEPMRDVRFLQGDCREPAVVEQIRAALDGRPVDLVLSDMAPNLTGIRDVDEARSVELAEVAFEAAQNFLRPGGTMLSKLFHHNDSERFLREMRAHFERITRRKPAASRRASAEFYVVASGYKG